MTCKNTLPLTKKKMCRFFSTKKLEDDKYRKSSLPKKRIRRCFTTGYFFEKTKSVYTSQENCKTDAPLTEKNKQKMKKLIDQTM